MNAMLTHHCPAAPNALCAASLHASQLACFAPPFVLSCPQGARLLARRHRRLQAVGPLLLPTELSGHQQPEAGEWRKWCRRVLWLVMELWSAMECAGCMQLSTSQNYCVAGHLSAPPSPTHAVHVRRHPQMRNVHSWTHVSPTFAVSPLLI